MLALTLVVPALASAAVIGLIPAHGSPLVKPEPAAVMAARPARGGGVGGVHVTVPLVATTVTDGLPVVLSPGGHRVSLPTWQAPNGSPVNAALSVIGARVRNCAGQPLRPGQVVRLSCDLDVPRGAPIVVISLRAGALQVAHWTHRGG